jgi:hypothetical protein
LSAKDPTIDISGAVAANTWLEPGTPSATWLGNGIAAAKICKLACGSRLRMLPRPRFAAMPELKTPIATHC